MVQTYRKFDKFRAQSSFTTVLDPMETVVANRWISTGTGTPAALAVNAAGGVDVATSAASGDSNLLQRGIETAATKLASIPLRKGKKVSVVGRVEHADFANMDIAFGLAPALANPFSGTGSIYEIIGSNTNLVVMGATQFAIDSAVTLAALRDKFGGIDLELYFDGQSKIALFAGGQRVGGFRNLTFDGNNRLTGFASNLSLSFGVITRSATAKTVTLRKLGYAVQITPDLGVPA